MTSLPRLLVLSFGLLLPALLLAERVSLNSTPDGATVRIVGPDDNPQARKETSWVTPTIADIARNRSGQPYQLEVAKPGYQTEYYTLDVRAKQLALNATLSPLRLERSVQITSSPAGAQVYVDNRLIGTTPATVSAIFTRTTKLAAWSTFDLRVQLADYQQETGTIALPDENSDVAPIALKLVRLNHPRTIKVTVKTQQGGLAIEKALVELEGQKVAETSKEGGAEVTLPFKRDSKTAPWPTFKVAVSIPDEYQRVEKTVDYDGVGDLTFELVPVTEMRVTKYFPLVQMTPRGPDLAVDTTQTIGTAIDDRDQDTPTENAVRVTNFERKSAVFQALNSFAITADGETLVYSVTYQNDDGKYYSNLFARSANPSVAATTQLTRGPRFLDAFPSMSREPNSTMVVFQSNRSRIDRADISSFKFVDGRISGGIQQLTGNTSSFNTRPHVLSEATPVLFTAWDDFPAAEPRLASVKLDGSTLTNLGEVGQMITQAEATNRIFFSRIVPDTKKYQIFSILPDGTESRSYLSDTDLALANCFSPAISPDGERLLFVSDHNADKAARKDNNLWMISNLNGNRTLTQLTNNISDDIQPLWSPTEPDVIYFLSNRRGVYNVWRLSLKR